MADEQSEVISVDEPSLDGMKGAFVGSLKRNNKQIKTDRAVAIAESAEMMYKRTVEDLEVQIKQVRRDRQALLDMSPTNTQSLILASDFDAKVWVQKDISLGVQIRKLEIELEIATDRYNYLFK
jgi:hypothetical protein